MTLKGKRVLFFAAPLYEDLELWYPKIRLEEEGAATTVAGMGEKTYQGKRGYPVTVDTDVDKLDAGDFDGLVIPGGFAPDQLRRSDRVLRLTREIYQAGKPVAFICTQAGYRSRRRFSRASAPPASARSKMTWKMRASCGKTARWWWTVISSLRARRPTCRSSAKR